MHGGGGAAAWLTETVWPATTTVAVRLPAALVVTATVAVPGPEPLPLTDAHDEPDDDVQAHPAAVVTDTLPWLPSGSSATSATPCSCSGAAPGSP